jgi:beta-phosphoglucomutase
MIYRSAIEADVLTIMTGHNMQPAWSKKLNPTLKDEDMKPSDVPDETRCVLERLHESGIKLSVGSSSRNASFILDKVGLRKYFDAVSDGNNITKSKPDPEVFLKAAQFLELAPSVCAVVEDADSGILAAKAGGFTAIGIGDGITTASADYRIQFLAELYSLIDGINGK